MAAPFFVRDYWRLDELQQKGPLQHMQRPLILAEALDLNRLARSGHRARSHPGRSHNSGELARSAYDVLHAQQPIRIRLAGWPR